MITKSLDANKSISNKNTLSGHDLKTIKTNNKICCTEQRLATRKDYPEQKYLEYNSNKAVLAYWMDNTIRENEHRELLPHSVKYKDDSKIIENENLLTYRCNTKTCHMNDTPATPASINSAKMTKVIK
jgi:hypothetical protein